MDKNNGRINLNTPDIKHKFNMFDKIPVKSNTFNDAMTGNIYDTQLSNLFFSEQNVQIIQNGIRAEVYKQSNNKYIISHQNNEVLHTIMRSIFLQNSKNQPDNITQQIQDLNTMVILDCTPRIMGEADGFIKFKEDVSTLPVPLDKPIYDNPTNHIEFNRFF